MQERASIIQWLHESIAYPVPTLHTEEEILAWLSEHCNTLLQKDFPALVQLLYRVDVSEARLSFLLRASPGEQAGKIMAILLLERVEQIVISRKKYRLPEKDIPEEDKW